MAHTPTPWVIDGSGTIRSLSSNKTVAYAAGWSQAEANANAALIIRAINSHAALVKALKGILADWDERNHGDREQLKIYAGHEYWSPRASMIGSECIAAARAALSQAEG